jgi:hypothetical protein
LTEEAGARSGEIEETGEKLKRLGDVVGVDAASAATAQLLARLNLALLVSTTKYSSKQSSAQGIKRATTTSLLLTYYRPSPPPYLLWAFTSSLLTRP